MAIKSAPLLIEWSPGRVRIHDPVAGKVSQGASISECMQGPMDGRSAIVGVSQRSAFIRSLYVPKASRSETAKVLRFQLASLLPISPNESVFGFRLGADDAVRGRLAVVGAIKSESLQKIYADAKTNGLHIHAVLPLAFGSWLAAREQSLNDCAVVESDEKTLTIDLIADGELRYSRSIPRPEAPEDLDDEIARTFSIAELPPTPVLSPTPGISSSLTYVKETIEYLADPKTIDSQLFSFELPEVGAQRLARQDRWRAQRAVAAAMAALILGGLAYVKQNPPKEAAAIPGDGPALLKRAIIRSDAAKTRLASVEKANRILDVAFKPSQTISDVITVLSSAASKSSWFTDLSIGRGMPLTINGIAMADSDVSGFIGDISQDPRFHEMKVVSVQKVAIGKKPVTQFKITGLPVGMLAFNKAPKARKRT